MAFLVFSSRQLKWKWLVLAKSTFLLEEGSGAHIRTGLLPPLLACKVPAFVSSLYLGLGKQLYGH